MALSSILSIGLHLSIFLFFYYGLPFSKIKDKKETIIPLIFEEELEVSNKTNLKKNEKLDKPQKNKQINSTIKNSPKPKPKKLISEKTNINTEKLPLKPIIKPNQKIKKPVEKNIDKKPFKRPTNKIKSKNRSSSSQAILRNLAEANVLNQKKDIINQIKESLKNQNQKNIIEEKKATISELDILRTHVAQCWNVPYSANEMNKIVKLKIFTNPDGSVVKVEILDVVSYQKDPIYRAAADSARRAVKDCSPLPLPKNKYDIFKVFIYNFDASFING
jgi:outer membrane biosynthesis protein TonB